MTTRKLFPALLFTLLAAAPATHPATTPASPAASAVPASAPAIAVNLSSPKATVATFLRSLQAGDETAAREAITFGDKGDQAMATLFLDLLFSTNAIQKASRDRFGAGSTEAFGDPEAALKSRLAALDQATPVITNNDAAVTLPDDAATNQPGATISLKKLGNDWKIDAASLFSLNSLAPEVLAQQVELGRQILLVNREVLAKIKAGDYQSASEAHKDLWERSFKAAQGVNGAATQAATTQP